MDKKELESQYDRFISQLRVEVDQLFWLYNFFFAIDSALIGTVFVNTIDYQFLAKSAGLILSLYWLLIMLWKNRWRTDWLSRIKDVEKELQIPDDFKMWPGNRGPGPGLWLALFLLPIIFIALWLVLLHF